MSFNVNLSSTGGNTTIGTSTPISISTAGVLTIANTTDSTSVSTGSIITSGGIGISDIADAISVTNGGSLTSAGGGAFAKSLFVGTAANLATVSGITTIGSSTAATISAAGVLTIANTTNSTSVSTGSIITSGGVGISQSLFVGTATNLATSSGITTIGSSTAATISAAGVLTVANTTSIANTNSFTGTQGAVNISGDMIFYNATKNTIAFRNAGVAAPSFTTRSNGTKILLWPNLSGAAVDFAIGIETLGIWNSVPGSGQKFYWYAGTTEIMRLDGTSTGILNINGTTTSTSSTTGSIVTAGGIATSNTTDATSSTNGGTFTSAGGGAFAKKLFVGTDLSVGGALSKGSGTFDIEHPIDSSKRLIHSFVEGPRCDNIYRGEVTLVDGIAQVNLDRDCVADVDCRMTEGTFQALNRNISYFLQNKTSFSQVLGKIEGNILTITCAEKETGTTISWLVVGERKDSHIQKWNMTNERGYLITEYKLSK